MHKSPIVTSKFKNVVRWGTLLSLLFLALTIVLFYLSITNEGIDSGYFALAAFISLFLIFIFNHLLRLKKIKVYDSYVTFKHILGYKTEKLFFSDIVQWGEKQVDTEKGGYRTLRVYSPSKNFTISEENYENYWQLKEYITQNKPDISNQRQIKYSKNQFKFIVILGVVSSLLLWAGYLYYLTSPHEPDVINETELIEITDIITNRPKTDFEGKNSKFLYFNLQSYPLHSFRVKDYAYNVMAIDAFFRDVYIGDSISIKILKEENPSLPIKKEESIWKTYPSYEVRIYELKILKFGEEYIYLSLDKRNEEAASEGGSEIILLIIASIISILAVVGIIGAKKELATKLVILNYK